MLSRALSSFGRSKKSDAPAPRRMANAEKYVGGRGTTEGVLRTEKRSNGRLRTSKVVSNFGDVLDVSASGCRIRIAKKPNFEAGSSIKLELKSEDISLTMHADVMWVRVMQDCTFHAGLRFTGEDPGRKAQLLDLLRNGVANEGLTRGWSPMAGFLSAEHNEE